MRCSDTAEIYLEDVRVPQSHLIGQEGMGFVYQMMQFQEERIFGVASCKIVMYKCSLFLRDHLPHRQLLLNRLCLTSVPIANYREKAQSWETPVERTCHCVAFWVTPYFASVWVQVGPEALCGTWMWQFEVADIATFHKFLVTVSFEVNYSKSELISTFSVYKLDDINCPKFPQ